MAEASSSYPETFAKLEAILSAAKDPFNAISLLRDERTLTPSELFLVANLAFTAGRVLAAQAEAKGFAWPARATPPDLSSVEKRLLLGTSGQPVFYVADAYSQELAKVRVERRNKEKAWRAEMAREADAVEKLLGRHVGLREEIPVRKSNPEVVEKARLMPELGEVRETMTHVHFRLKATREAVRLEREINRLRQREAALEEDVLEALSQELFPKADLLEKAAWALGELDYLLCKAALARKWGAVKPAIVRQVSPRLLIEDGIHPLVRQEVESRGGRYQPVTIDLDSQISIITGPNMGGKTVSLSTIGLCVALAQFGLLVPCSKMEFSLYDFIYFQPQTPGKPGLSSFASELVSLREPLSRKDERGLILLDEVARGTNPSQGLALYAAVLMHLRDAHVPTSTVVATTHYHGLPALVGAPHWQVAGLKPTLEELEAGGQGGRGDPGDAKDPEGPKDITWLYRHMDYRLQKVGPEAPVPQDALLVAKLLGLDPDIITRAESLVEGGRVADDVKTPS